MRPQRLLLASTALIAGAFGCGQSVYPITVANSNSTMIPRGPVLPRHAQTQDPFVTGNRAQRARKLGGLSMLNG